jgi:hypothetical protein
MAVTTRVHPVPSVRRRGDVVASAWTVLGDGPGSGRTIHLAGELDNDTAPELASYLIGDVQPTACLVVTFIGTSPADDARGAG